jgi:ribosomal protein L11
MYFTYLLFRDFFLDKQREKAKLELEMKLIVTMKQQIPAGEASREAPLGIILSQFYLPFAEFCPDFNSKTTQWIPGVILPTKVIKGLRAKEYKLYISSPAIGFLIEAAINEDNGQLEIAPLYDAIRLKSKELKKPLPSTAAMFLSTLHSLHIKRILIHK